MEFIPIQLLVVCVARSLSWALHVVVSLESVMFMEELRCGFTLASQHSSAKTRVAHLF